MSSVLTLASEHLSQLIEVAFKGNRKEFFLWDNPVPPPLRAPVVVEADRGEDLGYVHAVGETARTRSEKVAHRPQEGEPLRRALREGSEDDARRERELRVQDEEARRTAMEHVRVHDLDMKLSDAEWQWDGRKLTIYFTADRRVDFRKLVRDLASTFRARIELKQIGVRDEAKRLDGVGRCGRQYCSASWLPELRPVNLGVAKDQRLSLNPSQISGACGRLMCCLRYEHEFYVQSRKRFPKEGRILLTIQGEEKVVANDIFRDRVTLRNSEGDTRTVALLDLRDEIAIAQGGTAESGAAASEAVSEEDWTKVSARVLPMVQGELARELADSDPIEDEVVLDPDEELLGVTGEFEAASGDAGTRSNRSRRRRGRRGGRRSRRGGQPQGTVDDTSAGGAEGSGAAPEGEQYRGERETE